VTQLVRFHSPVPYVPTYANFTRNIQSSPAKPSKQGSSIGRRQLDVRTSGRTTGLTLGTCHSSSRKISILIIQMLDGQHMDYDRQFPRSFNQAPYSLAPRLSSKPPAVLYHRLVDLQTTCCPSYRTADYSGEECRCRNISHQIALTHRPRCRLL